MSNQTQNTQSTSLILQQFVKEITDRLVAAIALILLFPVMLVISIAIYFNMGNPIIFAQSRPGKNGRVFKFYKFRSMSNEKDVNGNLLPDPKRLTTLGQLIRRTSLDEIPQLLNILQGDMSFVGPRPLLVEFLDYYTPEQAHRHDVKPGVTGWAQVNGRNTLSWLEKCELDLWYVKHHSLGLDLKILLLTVGKVLKQEGVASSECSEISKQQLAAIQQAKRLSSN